MMRKITEKNQRRMDRERINKQTEGEAPKPGLSVGPPPRKAVEDIPFDLVIESDLALRRRLDQLSQKESKLTEIGAVALETYEEIFNELEYELEKAEQQTLAQIDQMDFGSQGYDMFTRYTLNPL